MNGAGPAPAGHVTPSAARYRKQREKRILVLLCRYRRLGIENKRRWNCSFKPKKEEIRRWETEEVSSKWERPAPGLEQKKKTD